jgi:hypothetical protein
MSSSIMETLMGADHNLKIAVNGLTALLPVVSGQLHNATVLLDKGYGIWTEIEPLLDEYGSVEAVPEV